MGADTGEYHDLITHPGMRILPYAQEQCKTCHKDTMQGVTMDLLVYLLTAGIIRGAAGNPYDVNPPRNTAVVNGSTTTLECNIAGYDGNVVWRDYHTSSDQDIIAINRNVFGSHRFSGAFKIEGTYNLQVTASSDMSGKYGCGTQDGTVQKYAYLIVTDSKTPDCEAYAGDQMVEGKETAVMCRYGCTGDYRPTLNWYNLNTSQPITTTIYNEGPCSIRGLAGFTPDASYDGADFGCSVWFQIPETSVMPSDGNHDQQKPLLTASCTKRLNVLYSARNVIITLPTEDTSLKTNDVISCSANGNPSPVITWVLMAGNATSGNVSGSSLTVTNEMAGYNKYACVATNVVEGATYTSRGESEFYVEAQASTPKRNSNAGAIAGGVIGGLLAIVLLAGAAYIIISKRNRRAREDAAPNRMDSMTSRKTFNDYMLTKPMQFINKHVLRRPESAAAGGTDEEGTIGAVSHWEVPRENLQLVKKLGEGSFGQVWKCEAWKLPQLGGNGLVAVKMLKENASDKDKQDLLGELDVMKNLPAHPNVVCLLGCCTGADPIMLVVEFLTFGNLKDYLKDKRAESRAEKEYMSQDDVTADVIGPRDLIFFAYQAAKGMGHIANHSLLHRDLAARNILVGEAGVCKVSDFGFARDVIDRNVYHRESQGPLPIRWMAPESIYDNVYTSQSDVWSFGVLLWEIVTMGANPYPGMSGRDVMDMIKQGKRMERPEHCTEEVYTVMTNCWKEDPEERPTFDKLTAMLDSMLQEESDYLCLDDLQDDLYENSIVIRGTDERI